MKSNLRKSDSIRSIFFLIIAMAIAVFFSIQIPAYNSGNTTTIDAELPSIDIFLNGTTIDEIKNGDKATKYQNNILKIIDTRDTSYINNTEIKLRGNLTFFFDKKPYQINFSESTPLLNLNSAKNWVLLANYLDDTYIRNDLAFYIEKLLNINYAPSGRFVNLNIDNEYQGLYYLTHKIKISDHSIKLVNPQGIVVEYDSVHQSNTDGNCYHSATSSCFVIKDVKNDDYRTSAMQDFLTDINRLEIAIQNNDYNAIQSLIDVEDFAKYFLLSEITSNPDSYAASVYLYKDGPDDLIHIGPGWDFDLAFGNQNWSWASFTEFYDPSTPIPQITNLVGKDKTRHQTSNALLINCYISLLDNQKFKSIISQIYLAYITPQKEHILSYAKSQLNYIQDSAAADSAHWNKNFQSDSLQLLEWLSKRLDFMQYKYTHNDKPNMAYSSNLY